MSDLTIQDIYDLFKASQSELQASREEYDRRAAEADRRAAEADRRAAEADRRAAEADRRLEKLEQLVANTSKEVGRLGDRWGLFVENLVAPAVLRLFQERGIAVCYLYRRVIADVPEFPMEIDMLAVNGDVVVVIEAKSRLAQEDVDNFCQTLEHFKRAFPDYGNRQVYGAVAAIEIVKHVDRYAYRRGLFVIRQCGDSVEIANDDRFRPAVW